MCISEVGRVFFSRKMVKAQRLNKSKKYIGLTLHSTQKAFGTETIQERILWGRKGRNQGLQRGTTPSVAAKEAFLLPSSSKAIAEGTQKEARVRAKAAAATRRVPKGVAEVRLEAKRL